MAYLTEKCGEIVDALIQVYQDFRDDGKKGPTIFYESAGSRILVSTMPDDMPSSIARRVNGRSIDSTLNE
jgi:hypothetical protein